MYQLKDIQEEKQRGFLKTPTTRPSPLVQQESEKLDYYSIFYCATFGENGVVDYLASLFRDEVDQDLENKTFTLQNGKRYLSRYFNSVDTLLYNDELQVTRIDDLVKYIQSFKGISEIGSLEEEIIRKRLESEFNNGMLIIPKEYGMFIARKES